MIPFPLVILQGLEIGVDDPVDRVASVTIDLTTTEPRLAEDFGDTVSVFLAAGDLGEKGETADTEGPLAALEAVFDLKFLFVCEFVSFGVHVLSVFVCCCLCYVLSYTKDFAIVKPHQS